MRKSPSRICDRQTDILFVWFSSNTGWIVRLCKVTSGDLLLWDIARVCERTRHWPRSASSVPGSICNRDRKDGDVHKSIDQSSCETRGSMKCNEVQFALSWPKTVRGERRNYSLIAGNIQQHPPVYFHRVRNFKNAILIFIGWLIRAHPRARYDNADE